MRVEHPKTNLIYHSGLTRIPTEVFGSCIFLSSWAALATIIITLAIGCGNNESGGNNHNLNYNENNNENRNNNENTNQNINENQNTHPQVTSISFSEETTVTITDDGDHFAFPDVTRTADETLFLVYRRGNSHADNSGRIMKQVGARDGLTWNPPEVLYDEPGIDDRDPSVVSLADGDLLMSYFQYTGVAEDGGSLFLHEIFSLRSTDNGETFGAPSQVSSGTMSPDNPHRNPEGLWVNDEEEPIIVQACSSPIVETDTRLLLPIYGGNALNLDNLAGAPRSRISIYESTDAGSSWNEEPVNHDLASNVWLQEPALLVLPEDRMLLQVRTAYGTSPSSPGNLAQAVSEDGGRTWSSWESLGFVGHAPDLYRLDCGVVLSAFREINDEFTQEWVSFMYSLDDGQTWSELNRIEDCGAQECGYPSILELDENRLLIVYYTAGGESIQATIFNFTTTT